jgi:RNA:NAD 2'-phosphotransferase (TPT1/KptA family)
MIRVIEGHSIKMINYLPMAHIITREDMERMPALCHGTSQDAIPSILYSGLRPMGRNNIMFSTFPHFDDRIGVGQRSGFNQADAIIFSTSE